MVSTGLRMPLLALCLLALVVPQISADHDHGGSELTLTNHITFVVGCAINDLANPSCFGGPGHEGEFDLSHDLDFILHIWDNPPWFVEGLDPFIEIVIRIANDAWGKVP